MELKTDNLVAGYGDKHILNGISLTLPAGQITALLGPNGCGKSTLLKCFARLLTPWSGSVTLGDAAISSLNARQLARHLALLPQQHLTPEGITVRELVSYGRSPWLPLWGRLSKRDHQHVNAALDLTSITHLAHSRVSELSGGQRQRAWLALVLAQDTPVVLLDEPTTWLDINHQVELMRLMQILKQAGKTVVTVLHDLNHASRYCDHLVMLADGNVVAQGAPHTIMTPDLLQQVFHITAEIHPEPISFRPMCIIK